MDGSNPLSDIKGVGDKLSAGFAYLGLKTIDDLITYYPRRYDDYSELVKIKRMRPGQVTIEAKLTNISGRFVKRGLHITEAIASDDTASVRLVWFNQPYRQDSLKTRQDYYISGKYELKYKRFSINSPSIELKSDFPIRTARILPRYHLTKGLQSTDFRKALRQIRPFIAGLKETLPTFVIKQFNLMPLKDAAEQIHFPDNLKQLEAARRRLAFEEIFRLVMAAELNRAEYAKDKAVEIKFDETLAKKFVAQLPFKLTDDQRQAVWRIYLDMANNRPMNRLIEGDVGSGKTAVAAMASLMAINSGYQVAFMAPTELLARQHAQTVERMFRPIGQAKYVRLLTGSLSAKARSEVAKAIDSRDAMFIIGTQALIQGKIELPSLGLVVIDEQHRFGVNQRQALRLKGQLEPHHLSLSATPIPRSLALTLFGELDISRLIEKPTNRQPINTQIVSDSMFNRQLDDLKAELTSGRQMFIVCPSIDANPNYSVTKIYDWATANFHGFKVGLLHGRLDSDTKNETMQQFADGDLDVLVSTTVIEVGVDVPNATIMAIFDCDRFGLAQLHQLRGRVGRGDHPGRCYLVLADGQTAGPRLHALETSNDGFELAELDLNLRGPGAIYGELQHGAIDLTIAELSDIQLVKEARQAVKLFMKSDENLLEYPQLAKAIDRLQKLTTLN